MIYAVTFNPAIDNYLTLESLKEGTTNYYEQGPKIYGGKAQNVVRILKQYIENYKLVSKTSGEAEAIARGEFTKNSQLFNDEYIRTNMKININGKITELNQHINPLSIDSSKEIMSYLNEVVTVDDLVLISGKMTNEELNMLKDFRFNFPLVKIILDSSISDINILKQIRPMMIKPNAEEINELFQKEISSEKEYIECGEKLVALGIEQVIITLGEAGSLCVTNDSIYKIIAAKGRVVNTVGAGDSFVGGYLTGISKGYSLEDTLKFASACGCATAFNEGIASKFLIDDLKKEIKVNQENRSI